MTLFVLWNVFDEMANLPSAVESVAQALPARDITHVFVDGAYPSYPSDYQASQDGTVGFCRDSGIYILRPFEECEKRSHALRTIDCFAKEGDFVLVLDADEEITSIFCWPPVGTIDFTRDSDGVSYGRARLFAWEPGLEFRERHYDLYRADGTLLASLSGPGEACGFGVHHDQSHSKDRDEQKRAYYKLLREREGHPGAQTARN